MKMTPKNKNFFTLFCLIIIIHAFLSGCSPSDRSEGHVYLRLSANPSTLDPALITDLSGGAIAAKLFNGLVRLDEGMTIAPDIAESWEVSADGRVYTFHLRRGVRFSNGREVEACDFRYSLERLMAPATRSPNTWVLEQVEGAREFREGRTTGISGIRTRGRAVLEIHLRSPFSPFLSMLTTVPAFVVPREEVERAGGDFSSRPVGTGPFTVRSWLQNREVVLERNDDYFDGKTTINGLVYRVIPEDLTAVAEFELGNLDLLSLPASAFGRFMKDPKWKGCIVSSKGLNTYYLGMNTSKPPFDDREVRRAVAQAIDREKILRTFLEGRGRLARGPVPDLLRGWALQGEVVSCNPGEARRRITGKGLAGTSVSMYVTNDQEVMDLAEIIQSFLRETGITVEIRPLEWTSFKEAVNRGEPQLFWLSWWADYPDAENFLFPLFHSSNAGAAGNRTRYSSPLADSCIEKGRSAPTATGRDLFFRKAEDQVIDDLPLIPFWHKTDYTACQPWVRGVKSYPIYTMDKGTGLSLVRP